MSSKRIFLSAASDEFGALRVKLAAKLQRSGINVEYQEIFPHATSDTVRKLGDLINDCPLLVHIVGHNPGFVAAPAAVADLLDEIPSEKFLVGLPSLRSALGDLSGITYTQWEAFLALHLGVEVLLYAPSDVCEAGTKTLKGDFAQKQHLDRLSIARKRPDFCANEGDFIGNILADVYRHFGIPDGGLPSATPSYLPGRNPHFRGRKADLAHLHEVLDQSATIGITQQVALCASGGVGKSSLALEFGWDCFASLPTKFPGGVFWCDCRGRDVASLADGLAALAGPLGIDAGESGDPFPAARKVRDRLASGPPSLLILDNVIDSEQWKDKEWAGLLPAGSCRRLLTTRAENLGDHRIPMVRLDCLSIPDARALLHAYRDDVQLAERDDAVKEIINWFGGLAIGLTVVGIYLRIHSKITWGAYWKSLREKKLDAVRATEELAAPADYASRVDAVIDDLLHSQSPAEQRALFYASILPGDDVSDRWLIELLSDDLAAGTLKGTAPPGYPSFAHAVIKSLIERGILLRLIDTPVRKTVFLHQVIRERLRETMQTDPVCSREVAANVHQFAVRNFHRLRQWTQAIVESASFLEAQKFLGSMSEADCDPNVFTFNSVLAKAGSCDEAKAVLDQMQKAGVKPDPFTFKSLLTFRSLLSKTWRYDELKSLFDQIQQAGAKPFKVTFDRLLTKAGAYAEAKSVFDQMQQAGTQPNVKTFTVLLSKAGTYAEAKAVLDQMQQAGVKPNENTFTVLLSKAGSCDEAKAVLELMRNAGATRNVFNFGSLLSKTKTYAEAKAVLDQMQQAGVKPNENTFTVLLSKAGSCDEAKAVLELMRNAGATRNVFNFTSLLSKTKTYDEAQAVLDQMQKLGAKPDAFTLTALFSKQEGLPPVGEVLRWYYEQPYHPSGPLNVLIGSLKKLNRVEEAMTIVLQHPHLTAGQRLMREFPECALALFESAKSGDSCHPTADLALGILAMETNRPADARSHLQLALQRVTHPKQQALIQSKLELLVPGRPDSRSQ
jgi:pentatricopeptide repeat protein